MKKIYSIIGILALAITANAQTNNRSVAKMASINAVNPVNAVMTSTTTLLVPPSIAAGSSCTLTAYVGNAGDGYVTGTNTYGDYGKAQQYNLANFGLTTPATVGAAGVLVAKVDDSGAGKTVKVDVYADNAGAPGALLGSSLPVNLSAITAGTLNVFAFAAPVNLTTSTFYVSLDISGFDGSTGDTIVVAQTDDGCTDNVDGGWDYWSDGTWIKFSDPNNWQFTSTDLAILPQVTADMVTGVKSNIASVATISPNPSNGIFNVTLKSNSDVNITVANAIGQVVVNKNFTSTEVVSFDLSNQNNGVYFVTITNGNSKTVKKVVLNK